MWVCESNAKTKSRGIVTDDSLQKVEWVSVLFQLQNRRVPESVDDVVVVARSGGVVSVVGSIVI